MRSAAPPRRRPPPPQDEVLVADLRGLAEVEELRAYVKRRYVCNKPHEWRRLKKEGGA